MAVLMSYKDMGVATWECVRNCECRPMTIDALWTTRMSIKVRAQPLGVYQYCPHAGEPALLPSPYSSSEAGPCLHAAGIHLQYGIHSDKVATVVGGNCDEGASPAHSHA